jgi:hypothetical protein
MASQSDNRDIDFDFDKECKHAAQAGEGSIVVMVMVKTDTFTKPVCLVIHTKLDNSVRFIKKMIAKQMPMFKDPERMVLTCPENGRTWDNDRAEIKDYVPNDDELIMLEMTMKPVVLSEYMQVLKQWMAERKEANLPTDQEALNTVWKEYYRNYLQTKRQQEEVSETDQTVSAPMPAPNMHGGAKKKGGMGRNPLLTPALGDSLTMYISKFSLTDTILLAKAIDLDPPPSTSERT